MISAEKINFMQLLLFYFMYKTSNVHIFENKIGEWIKCEKCLTYYCKQIKLNLILFEIERYLIKCCVMFSYI